LADLQKSKAVTVGIVNQLPGSGVQPDGSMTGFSPDLMNVILPDLGITKITPKVGEWSTLIPGLLADHWDFVGAQMVINADRCPQVLFSNPWSASPEVFAYVGDSAPSSLKDVAANPKLKLAVQSGSTFLTPIHAAGIKDSQLVTVADIRSGLDALTAGRADLLIAGKPSILGIKDLDSRIKLSADITDSPTSYTAYVFKKGDTALRDAFNAAIAKLTQDGTLETISKKWGYDVADIAGKTADGLCASMTASS